MNRPYAGARTQKDLPQGDAPLQLYSLGTPNGIKVTVALEEMKLDYDAHTIQIKELDQFTTGFTDICPNGKIPAMLDKDGPDGEPIRVFESGSILLYLAEKTGQFIPPRGTADRTECLNWLFFQMGGIGPFFGQFGHFYKYAAEKLPYPIERYSMETKRLLDVLDQQLEGKQYIIGDEYTIADMAIFPWVLCLDVGYKAKEYLAKAFGRNDEYANVEAWMERCLARPAVQAGMKVNHLTEKSCFGEDKGPAIERE
uniref:Glutathione S-transferase n=1 Tax=Hirondellea gigas TaxID=1518452 RepID=A0A6A7G842_9CRUS